jgi:hypothetical protein
MHSSFRKVSCALLVVVLATGVLAIPARAADRESPRHDPGSAITRVIKQIKHLLTSILDEEQIGVPKP